VSDPLAAAVAAGRDLGLRVDDPVVLADGASLLVHLRPEPVVARVSLVLDRGRGALADGLRFARAAVDRGGPVVVPADDDVHERDGVLITFWRHVEHRRAEVQDAPAVGAALRALHAAVAEAELDLPRFDRLDEVEAVARGLDHPDVELMLRAIAVARERLAALDLVEQPLHGDSHMRNVLVTDAGPLWCDLENVCRGPVEYDLACLAWRTRVHGWGDAEAAFATYGAYDSRLVDDLMPVLAAFLVPLNARLASRAGDAFEPIMRERLDYLRTFT
jgi:Ser/Thr protein kinase RdoA (MazF antagonist)